MRVSRRFPRPSRRVEGPLCWVVGSLSLATCALGQRPAGNQSVYFAHQADGFVERDNDLLVVINVVRGKLAAFAVFQPLLADLVAADLELPNLFGHSVEILRIVDIDAACRYACLCIRFHVVHLFDSVLARLLVSGDKAA